MFKTRHLRFLAVTCLALFLGASTTASETALTLRDDFEAQGLNSDIWSDRRLMPGSVEIQAEIVRSGERSLALTVHPGHDPLADGSDRAELAEAAAVRLPAGQEVWYGFSMRIDRRIPVDGNRLVIGQWHQTIAGSPFVAQRFRDGHFHITVQDGGCRVWIAWQSGAQPNSRRGCRVEVEQFGHLPRLDSGWIDMVYRIRAGPGGDGLVEVWANGRRIARATGAIGYLEMQEQFFKFGPYRDPVAYPMTVYLDNFRRGASFADVDPSPPGALPSGGG